MKNLFKSQTSFELVDYFTKNPKKCFYLGELSQALKKDPANIVRELERLSQEGIIKISKKQNKKFYAYNSNASMAEELIGLFNKYRSSGFKDNFNEDWMLAEDIMNMDPAMILIPLNCFVDQFVSPGGRAYKKISSIHQGYHMWFYYEKNDAHEVGEHLVDRFEKDPSFMAEVNEKIVECSDKMEAYMRGIPETKLEKLSDRKLYDIYKKYIDIHTEFYRWSWIPVAADMFGNNLTERGKAILRKYGVKPQDIEKYLIYLTQPTEPSRLKIEQDEFIRIGIMVQKDKKQFELFRELFRKFKEEDVKYFGLYTHSKEYEEKFEQTVKELINSIKPSILKALQNHYAKYFYTKFIYTEEQGVYSFEHYLKSLVRLVNSDHNLEKTYLSEQQRFNNEIAERKKLIEKLKLDAGTKKFFDAWGEFMLTKIYRRYVQFFTLYKINMIYGEIADRLGMSLKEVKFMLKEEIHDALIKGKIKKDEIRKRVIFSVYYADKEKHLFYTGSEAEEAAKLIQKGDVEEVSELKGQCGCRGYAKGSVKIINVVSDMQKMKPGDILVSISTQPDLLPAMKKAAAFVTDQGGVTSHAAIVAREMNMPCVIATKIATKVLHDGDLVEVDADRGIVKKIT